MPQLHAVVIPRPSREATDLTTRQLPPPEALVELCRYPRVGSWREPQIRRARFRLLAQIAEQVPVFCATIPWGPPFDPGLAGALVIATGLAEAMK